MNKHQLRPIAAGFLLAVLAMPRTTWAGMPSLTITDIGEARFKTISFFTVAFLTLARVIQALWNSCRNDFPRLPRLSYGRAVSVTLLWGLLFLLVLTMISGARELLTPGAWQKKGATYKLADPATENHK